MGVSLISLRRARPGIDLRIFGWVCVYAPRWPGISFWRYPFLDLRLEKWVRRWVGGLMGVWGALTSGRLAGWGRSQFCECNFFYDRLGWMYYRDRNENRRNANSKEVTETLALFYILPQYELC